MWAVVLLVALAFAPAFADHTVDQEQQGEVEEESKGEDEEKLTLEDAKRAVIEGYVAPTLMENPSTTPPNPEDFPPDPRSEVVWREFVISGEVVGYERTSEWRLVGPHRTQERVYADCYELADGTRVETSPSLDKVPVGETVFVYREGMGTAVGWGSGEVVIRAYDRLMPTKEKK